MPNTAKLSCAKCVPEVGNGGGVPQVHAKLSPRNRTGSGIRVQPVGQVRLPGLREIDGIWSESPHVRALPRISLAGCALDRWTALVTHAEIDFRTILLETRRHLREVTSSILGITETSCWVSLVSSVLLGLFAVFSLWSHYRRDLLHISQLAFTHHRIRISVGQLFLLNCIYELSACTSAVTRDESDTDGRPLHVRTLDWPLPPLARHTVHLAHSDATDTSGVAWESATWPGMVGEMTAVKPGAFSISLNARYPATASATDLNESWGSRCLLKACRASPETATMVTLLASRLWNACWHRGWSAPNLIRYVLETCTTYEEAVHSLAQSPLVSDAYLS